MVERDGNDADPASVPSIAALLQQYRDRTGASYDDMSRLVGGRLTGTRLHQLATKPPDSLPRKAETVQHLADLLQVSVTTVLEAFAVSLGLDVEQRRPLLAITLPPGTDNLTDRDRAAILAVVRQLVEARRETPPTPDISKLEGLRLGTEEPSNRNTLTGQ